MKNCSKGKENIPEGQYEGQLIHQIPNYSNNTTLLENTVDSPEEKENIPEDQYKGPEIVYEIQNDKVSTLTIVSSKITDCSTHLKANK